MLSKSPGFVLLAVGLLVGTRALPGKMIFVELSRNFKKGSRLALPSKSGP